MTTYGPPPLGASETSKLLEEIIGYLQKTKHVIAVYKCLLECCELDIQNLRDEWNRELECSIQLNQ